MSCPIFRPEIEEEGTEAVGERAYDNVDLEASALKDRCRQLDDKYKVVSEQKVGELFMAVIVH